MNPLHTVSVLVCCYSYIHDVPANAELTVELHRTDGAQRKLWTRVSAGPSALPPFHEQLQMGFPEISGWANRHPNPPAFKTIGKSAEGIIAKEPGNASVASDIAKKPPWTMEAV